MAIDEDEELLQDFLVEAGEILEQLSEQLVDLENRPKDSDLLNAVFRGFHTIKGGASFLNLEPLVALCHRAEDVFNVLRNGERMVDATVMDIMLPVLDVLNEQFASLRAGTEMQSAEPAMLQQLEALSVAVDSPVPAQDAKPAKRVSKPPTASDQEPQDLTNEEYQSLMNSLENNAGDSSEDVSTGPATKPVGADDDDITEEEFEALLDQMQGVRGGASSANAAKAASNDQTTKPAAPVTNNAPAGSGADKEEITEEEFDALLDELHGKGASAKVSPTAKPSTPATSKAPVKPAGKPVSKAAAPQANTSGVRSEPPTATTPSPTAAVSVATAKAKEAQQAESTVRVDTKRLDDIMNMVGELVLVRNRMATLEAASNDEEMSKVVANLDVVTADLQAAVMKTRMQPIKKVFGRFPRVVRDLARSLKKEVNLELQGEDTDLDKNLVEALADPLVHLVRNAVDHGIESPEERVAKGKTRTGTVILTAEQEGDHILLTIQDDGKGMDPDKLRTAAVAKGMMDEDTAARLEPKDCYNLIFQPGFSTKTEISDVSGRGVGMDVVKTRIVQLNGSVEIDSALGKGSTIIIKVPLTLAIMPTLMVMLETQIFALPLASVNEIFHINLTQTNMVDGQLVVMIRDKALPLFYLRHWLVKGARTQSLPQEGHVVVVSMGVQRIGFVVDQLIGQEEVVIKPLGALLHGMKGLAGATITGDGRISLILDIPGLMQRYARRL